MDEAPLLLPDVLDAEAADPVTAPESGVVMREEVKEPVAVNAPRTELVFDVEEVRVLVLLSVLLELLLLDVEFAEPEEVDSFKYEGGAVAFAALTRAPVPHLTPSAVSEGSTVFPLSSLMAKRPVQNRFSGSLGVEN